MDETFTEIERALGLRDSKHRHREAKKHELPMGSGDQPNLEALLAALYRRMIEYDEIDGDLREEKLKLEIKVLTERHRKMEMGNQATEGNLVDVNELFEWADKLASFIRRAGDLLARKNTITGQEAQEIVNNAVDEFEQASKEFKSNYSGNGEPNGE